MVVVVVVWMVGWGLYRSRERKKGMRFLFMRVTTVEAMCSSLSHQLMLMLMLCLFVASVCVCGGGVGSLRDGVLVNAPVCHCASVSYWLILAPLLRVWTDGRTDGRTQTIMYKVESKGVVHIVVVVENRKEETSACVIM
jgi:hypothetical protein